MKKIMVVILIVVMMGCNLVVGDDFNDGVNLRKIQKTDLIYMEEWEELENWQDIVMWIWCHVYYSSDGENKDTWNTPLETLNRGKGDCEDFVLLFMNIYYVRFGVKLDMAALDANKRIKVNGGYFNHAEVLFKDGRTLCVLRGSFGQGQSISYRYEFDLFFK